MKILHIPFTYYPDPVGGTEVYVRSLARALAPLGISSVVAAPGQTAQRYDYGEVRVHRFPLPPPGDVVDLYNAVPRRALPISRVLEAERPDVVHMHALTSVTSVHVARAAKDRGIPVVFTYHLPAISCQRGTLLLWGKEECNGVLDVDLCTRCALEGLGLVRPVADVVGRVPIAAGRALERWHRSGGVWTAARMRHLVSVYHHSVRQLLSEVDRVVVLCEWSRQVLIRNGVPSAKMTLSRHGVPLDRSVLNTLPSPIGVDARPLKVAYLGRLDHTKGPDLLVRALRRLPAASVALDMYGVTQDDEGEAYRDWLTKLAADDIRIRVLPPAPHAEVARLLRGYHVLAVPSRWLETGPLVVLEAFAAGTPVVGSDRGGIAEVVRDGVDGLLVPGESPAAWAFAIKRLNDSPDLLRKLRSGISDVRGEGEVARDMSGLYVRLLEQSRVNGGSWGA